MYMHGYSLDSEESLRRDIGRLLASSGMRREQADEAVSHVTRRRPWSYRRSRVSDGGKSERIKSVEV